MKWKDVSSYSRDAADRSPRTFELRTGRVCVTITRWIHGDPNKWYLLCYEAGFASHRELQAAGIPEAQQEALHRVILQFEKDLYALREYLLEGWKQSNG